MEKSGLLKELQRDLARKYRLHGPKIEEIWHSLGKGQRERVSRAGAAEGQMLKSPIDRSLGNVYKFIPDWNLRDISNPDSDYLLDCLKHRATKSLCEQYIEGVHGGPGDFEVIVKSMHVHGLKHVDPFRYSFTLFMDEEQYGQSFTASDRVKYEETMAAMKAGVDAGLILPQSTGELILERQSILLTSMNIVIQDILEAGSTFETKGRSKKSEKAAREAMSKLAIDQKPEKLSLEELAALSLDQKSALEDYVRLCRTEPEFLTHAVNAWFFSRPELVADEKGRRLPLITDKYISIAFFEMIHNAVSEVDLSGFAVPIDNLIEPGMAQGALTTLDGFISNNTGAEIGFLYQDMNEECLLDLLLQVQQQKEKNEQVAQAQLASLIPEAPTREMQIEQRKEKTKTRPPHSSVYSITPTTAPTTQPEPAVPSQAFKVKPSFLEVFSTLFSKQRERSSITWAAFQAAMAHMKFSVVPKTGSVYTFSPPEGFNVQRSITLHRPHQSRVEGWRLLYIASRLKREYGWDEKSFETE
ncbi:hypothetical protein ANOM_002815 [Aspergillus nomiae NRRL 13137]|uniref:Ipa protein n=1 Tax=Aspergillus nomiae NRRL (strain ATCC 15546 / NRRL 13137 / CBS 260.88 / M93) TaxID=1509407 RepID=A0A0L1JAI4_ASPN3|nr:uncharacterized protein ANOM_002815 [Aspergillus nomiae NRRL 13137]KNG88764.1 hypothetical protein ANOM_002815 [Aspergillus nomiae NRRL 13137]